MCQRAFLPTCILSGRVAGGARTGTMARVGVQRTGLTCRGAWDVAERPRLTRETLWCVGDSWYKDMAEDEKENKHFVCLLFCHRLQWEGQKEGAKWFLTFYLNIFQQNGLHHFGPHQDSTRPPVQDVGARLQVHLEHTRFHALPVEPWPEQGECNSQEEKVWVCFVQHQLMRYAVLKLHEELSSKPSFHFTGNKAAQWIFWS